MRKNKSQYSVAFFLNCFNSFFFFLKIMFDWSRIVNHPLFNIGCFLVLRQVTSYFGLDHSENLDVIRTLYLGSQFIVIVLSFYLLSVIKSKNGK